jgi:hypothetical protein
VLGHLDVVQSSGVRVAGEGKHVLVVAYGRTASWSAVRQQRDAVPDPVRGGGGEVGAWDAGLGDHLRVPFVVSIRDASIH